MSFFYAASRWSGEVSNSEPEKCASLLWVDPADLDEVPVIGYIADAVEAVAAGQRYSAHGW